MTPIGSLRALVAVGRDVAAADADANAHLELRALVERGDDLLRVDQLELGGNLEVRAGHDAGPVTDSVATASPAPMPSLAEDETLHVEHDVGDVLAHALDRRELVLHAFDADRGRGRALEATTAARGACSCRACSRSRAPAARRRSAQRARRCGSTVTWGLMNSVIKSASLADLRSRLLRVQLDDELLADRRVDLVARRQRQDLALQLLDVDLEPPRDLDLLRRR